MAFMQPVVYEDDYFSVETEIGTEIVPADLLSPSFAVNFVADALYDEDNEVWPLISSAVSPYVEGNDIREISPRRGYLARMSAPGYMDCTDWTAHDTAEEAFEYLKDTYGEDGEDA